MILTDQVLIQDADLAFDEAYKISMRENNMGCLAELDFWGQPAVTKVDALAYEASWNGQNPDPQHFRGTAPLDDCYIVESTTDMGRGPRKANETYRFVADFFSDFYTDSTLLTEFASGGINFEAQIGEWMEKRRSALESPRFNRLGRFKLVVPLEAIQDYLVAEVCKEALEAAFEHRHSAAADSRRFVENQVTAFKEEHRFDTLTEEILLTKDGEDVKKDPPNYSTALAEIGDVKEFERAVKARADAIHKFFEAEVHTKVDEWITHLIEALRNRWIHGFSNFGVEERARVSARNTVVFLEDAKAALDALAGGLDAFYPEHVVWIPEASKANAWRAFFKKLAMTKKGRGKQAKAEAAQWLSALRVTAHKAFNNRAKAEYVERSRRVIGNLLEQAYAITEQLVRPGSGMKSRIAQESGQAAQAMADDVHAMKHSLVRRPEELEKFLPDWVLADALKEKIQSVYQRWVSGDYSYSEEDDQGNTINKNYWDGSPQGFVHLLWSMVSHKAPNDVLEEALGQKAPAELESKRRAELTRFQVQLKEVCRRILNQEWKLDQLGEKLTAWKVLLTFDNKPKTGRDLEIAFRQRWRERVAMAECLSAYNPAIGSEGRRGGAGPIQERHCLYDKPSAQDAALAALEPYLNISDKLDPSQAFTSLVGTELGTGAGSALVKPTEIVILNMEGRCFLRNFPRASDGVESVFENPDFYPKWLDQRFPAWIKLRDKALPEPDEAVQHRRLRCALAWAWRKLDSGSGLNWNRDQLAKGPDVFLVEQEAFEDFPGLFEGLPQHQRAWKTVTSKLSYLWRQMGLDARKKALADAKKQLSNLAAKRQDTLKCARQTMIKTAVETVAKLLDQGDEFLTGFTL